MTNIIGLTKLDGYNVMVNADQILYWEQAEGHVGGSIVFLAGGVLLSVKEDMYEIVERIEPEPDYTAE